MTEIQGAGEGQSEGRSSRQYRWNDKGYTKKDATEWEDLRQYRKERHKLYKPRKHKGGMIANNTGRKDAGYGRSGRIGDNTS